MKTTTIRTDVSEKHLCQKQKKNLLGFTLVELIVVITILVILGTIAFTQLGGFSSNARDSDRVTTLKNIESGLDIHQIKSGSYPTPENITGTGVINNTVLSFVGTIGDSISRIIRINKIPTDPLSKTNYVYGTNQSRTQYQIATTLENAIAYNTFPIIPTVYADASLQARVNGNYSGYIKYSSGAETWIANIPSLIFNNTGSTNLLGTGTYFVVNRQQNLPYKLDDKTQIQNKNPDEVIRAITNMTAATLTGVNITAVIATNTSAGVSALFTGTLLSSFGGNIAVIETAVLGKTASVVPPFTCGTSTVTDADNNSYNTVSMVEGTQCWMKTNLRTTKKPDGTLITKWNATNGGGGWATDTGQYSCPPNSTNNGEDCTSATIYGMLYQWSAAMNTGTTNITDGGQGICPNGWHVPRDIEWKALMVSQDTANCDNGTTWQCGTAGSKLAWGTWTISVGGINGTGFGTSGFNVQPSGYRGGGNYYSRADYTFLWSSTAFNASSAWRRYFDYSMPSVYRDTGIKASGFSLRCLKD